jgi:hypothetical protein
MQRANGTHGESKACLWVSVNRGVLIEERPLIEDSPASEPFSEVIDWLTGSRRAFSHLQPEHGRGLPPWLRRAELAGVDLLALALDKVSLFEPQPANNVQDWADLAILPLEADRSSSAAGALLNALVAQENFEGGDSCQHCPASSVCPFLANARTLRSSAGAGFLRVSRASELATGQLFSFRDLWALCATAIVGRARPEYSRDSGPCDWVRDRASRLTPRLQPTATIQLALQRLQYSLFEDTPLSHSELGTAATIKGGERPAAVRRLDCVDPLLVATDERVRIVSDALLGIALDHSPVQTLRQADPALAASLEGNAIEAKLEHLIAASESEEQRRSRTSLLAVGLYRTAALAKGNHAFVAEISRIIELWNGARTNANVPTVLARAVRDWILGKRTVLTLPLANSRAAPDAVRPGTLVAQVPTNGTGSPTVTFFVDGSQVTAHLDLAGTTALRLPVDIGLAREALAQSAGGFTEASGSTAPRLERARAALLSARSGTLSITMHAYEEV